jgi:hypothetical protein
VLLADEIHTEEQVAEHTTQAAPVSESVPALQVDGGGHIVMFGWQAPVQTPTLVVQVTVRDTGAFATTPVPIPPLPPLTTHVCAVGDVGLVTVTS